MREIQNWKERKKEIMWRRFKSNIHTYKQFPFSCKNKSSSNSIFYAKIHRIIKNNNNNNEERKCNEERNCNSLLCDKIKERKKTLILSSYHILILSSLPLVFAISFYNFYCLLFSFRSFFFSSSSFCAHFDSFRYQLK